MRPEWWSNLTIYSKGILSRVLVMSLDIFITYITHYHIGELKKVTCKNLCNLQKQISHCNAGNKNRWWNSRRYWTFRRSFVKIQFFILRVTKHFPWRLMLVWTFDSYQWFSSDCHKSRFWFFKFGFNGNAEKEERKHSFGAILH